MAVKIEKGGWILIFLIGLALVGYSLVRYGVIDSSKFGGSGGGSKSSSSGDKSIPPSLWRCLSHPPRTTTPKFASA